MHSPGSDASPGPDASRKMRCITQHPLHRFGISSRLRLPPILTCILMLAPVQSPVSSRSCPFPPPATIPHGSSMAAPVQFPASSWLPTSCLAGQNSAPPRIRNGGARTIPQILVTARPPLGWPEMCFLTIAQTSSVSQSLNLSVKHSARRKARN